MVRVKSPLQGQGSLNSLTALEALRRIAQRELTVESLVSACLERIETREQCIGAWVHIDPEAVLANAREIDRGALEGTLCGLPIGVKDLIDTVQYPTSYGSVIYATHQPAWDASCVSKARSAGALVLGKTVTTEFATYHPGKTANPHNPTCTPGGSSSGSAAAVADDMVPLALGTQTAGSVIRPAAYCGVVGFKPTYGWICRAGVKSLSESLDTLGVFARNVKDAALFAGCLAGQDWLPGDNASPPRIGVCRTSKWDQAENSAQQVFESAIQQFSRRGAILEDKPLPKGFDTLYLMQAEIMAYEAVQALHYERRVFPEHLSTQLYDMLSYGGDLPPEQHDANLSAVRQARNQLDSVFGDCDILMTLSTTGEAPIGLTSTGDPLFNRVWTALGTPCLHLPLTRGPRGLPLGIQIIGRLGDERRVLAAAQWAFSIANSP